MPQFTRKPWARALALIILFLAFMAAFMEIRASGELKKARAFQESGASEKAIVHYFRALNWYSPVGASASAAQELYDLSASLKSQGESAQAYLGFLRLRAALNAARSFYFPRADLLDASNRELSGYLASLKIKEARALGTESALPADFAENETERYYRIYSTYPVTHEGSLFAAVVGFLAWTLGGAWAIARFFRAGAEGLPLSARASLARRPLALFALGYIIWIVGMAWS
ncbi:MAG: hypothetical protein LBO66_11520 [Deltaproteobacteria bacterium]|jgi:hypothetical protein|nr:hypothetical protein [Deltaproteobacteria bacterium]